VFVVGGAALVCGYGLWTLRPYGRYIQMALSFLGLIGFPLQTIISILILFYMFKPGVQVLFSGEPLESLGPAEQAQLRSLDSSSAAAIVVAVVVASFYAVAVVGIIAAIAIPNLLNAIDRGKQKRTMADLRSIATAVESYAVDNNFYPTVTTAADLRPSVEPKYIKTTPMVDGWGHTFEVNSSTTRYVIFSHGKDGVGDDCTPGQTSRFDDEICFANGEFARYPAGPER
jgi:general secretion pathway protein G